MRCLSCNTALNDREATRKSSVTGQYIDLCDDCIKGTNIAYIEKQHKDDYDEEENDTTQN